MRRESSTDKNLHTALRRYIWLKARRETYSEEIVIRSEMTDAIASDIKKNSSRSLAKISFFRGF
jgi:hypothetical protein